jgi:DHA2 family multidrug resistance protein-like MFS transporter
MMTYEVPAKAGRREWIGLAVIALPCILYSMDLTVLNLAIPKLSADLKPTGTQLLWIVDVYGFVLSGFLITMGAIGDRIGRRKLLMIGAGAFGVGSVAAAFSRNAEMLIATRALLGIAGATLAPSTLSLIRNMFNDPKQRTTAIGVWISSYSIGGAVGPLVGGVMLEHFWWGSVFLISVPVMLLLLAVAPLLLPEFRDPNAGRPDVSSSLLSLTAVLLTIYGVKQIAQNGANVIAFASIIAGITVGAVFIRRQKSLRDPFIDVALFRRSQFSAALAAYTLATFVAFGIYLFIGQYLQLVKGLSALRAGLVTLPSFAVFIGGSLVIPVLSRRFKPANLLIAGLCISGVGFAMLATIGTSSPVWWLMAGNVVYSIGLAPVVTLTTDLIVGAAPPERAGAAAAISETGSELGGAMGIAVLGSVGTAVYRNAMSHGFPAGVSRDLHSAAQGTLGGAVAVAKELPVRIGAQLVDSAHGAFTRSFSVTAALCVVVVMATAVFVGVLVRPTSPPQFGD